MHFNLPLPVTIVLAVAISTAIATPIAWVCTRTHGVSFAMLTLAFAQLGYAMIYRFKDFTGGSDGLTGIPRPEGPFGLDFFQSKIGYFYMVLFCLLGSFLLCRALVNSPFGDGALRHPRKRSQDGRTWLQHPGLQAGHRHSRLRLRLPGRCALCPLCRFRLAGAVLLADLRHRSDHGDRRRLGHFVGPIIGGVFFLMLENQLREVTDLWPLIFGSVFIAFVMLAPQGIWGILTARFKKPPVLPQARRGRGDHQCPFLNARA